jgi:hypothetical protein
MRRIFSFEWRDIIAALGTRLIELGKMMAAKRKKRRSIYKQKKSRQRAALQKSN